MPINESACHISSFYSYKGGSGRSVGLANCAFELAQSGRKVACLELDVEAPGLLNIFGTDKRPERSIVDLLVNFDVMDLPKALVDVKRACYPELKGELLVIPALREDRKKLDRIEWQREYLSVFYDNVISPLEEGAATKFPLDYILIDSRSGVTNASLLAMLLANHAIVFFTRLDRQSRAGTAFILSEVRRVLTPYGRRIAPIVVFSAVPESGRVEQFLAEARAAVECDTEVVLPFDAELQLEEHVVMAERPDRKLAAGYKKLVELL